MKRCAYPDKAFLDKASAYYGGKRILLTGGAGFVGTNVISFLKNIECRIVCFDRKGCGPEDGAKARITCISGDIQDGAIWERLLRGTDVVFHLAAQTSSRVANEDPVKDIGINVKPMVELLETCRRHEWKPAVIFSGTVTEAGMTKHLPVKETVPDHPITVYDVHKLTAEIYLEYYTRIGAVKGATLRMANIYGPGPESASADRGVLNTMILAALKGGPITLYGGGKHIRDYLYIDDAVRALVTAAMHIDALNGGHFVIGSGKGYRILDAFRLVAERVEAKTGRHVEIARTAAKVPPLEIESRDFVADYGSFRRLTGYRPRCGLKEGIDRTIDFFSIRAR